MSEIFFLQKIIDDRLRICVSVIHLMYMYTGITYVMLVNTGKNTLNSNFLNLDYKLTRKTIEKYQRLRFIRFVCAL